MTLSLHLVDSTTGKVVQTWRFKGKDRVVIGRGFDSDIRLADSSVSRLHVEFVFDQQRGGWILRSLGRNGTHIEGEPVKERLIGDRTVFRLGSSGPQFLAALDQKTVGDQDTLIGEIDAGGLECLVVNEQQKAEEVRQIVEGDRFQLLKERAKLLRSLQKTPPTEELSLPPSDAQANNIQPKTLP
jgi:pSer/pThr/pTyr-binding forkhead associated (FHA) protein